MVEVQQLFPGEVTELNTDIMPSPPFTPQAGLVAASHGTAAVSGWLMKTTAVTECSPLYRAGMLLAQGSVWLGWSILLTLLVQQWFGAARSREKCSAELLPPRRAYSVYTPSSAALLVQKGLAGSSPALTWLCWWGRGTTWVVSSGNTVLLIVSL